MCRRGEEEAVDPLELKLWTVEILYVDDKNLTGVLCKNSEPPLTTELSLQPTILRNFKSANELLLCARHCFTGQTRTKQAV